MQALETRAWDQHRIPTLLLMENAGRTVAREIARGDRNRKRRILVLCGKGNNGGDGLAVARHLHLWGHRVEVVIFGDPRKFKQDPLRNYAIVERLGIPRTVYRTRIIPLKSFDALLSRSRVVVDALFGTGLKRPLEPPYLTLIRLVNRAKVRRVAIDVPSGLDADTGKVWGEVIKAHLTVTLGCPKVGFRRKAARRFTGRIVTGYISLPGLR